MKALRSLFFIFFLCFAFDAGAATLVGEVIGIADGDTLTLLDSSNQQHKIRLSGIDAPEKRQAFGTRSRQYLAELVFRNVVTVEMGKRDRYGRIIGKVQLGSRDVNLLLVTAGLAWHYKAYAREQSQSDARLYSDAEDQARVAKRGLWVDGEVIAPWDFRRRSRRR